MEDSRVNEGISQEGCAGESAATSRPGAYLIEDGGREGLTGE